MNSSITYKLICTTLSLMYPLIQRTFCQHKPISSYSLNRILLFYKKISSQEAFQKHSVLPHSDLFPQKIKHILFHISRICVIYLVVWLIPITCLFNET